MNTTITMPTTSSPKRIDGYIAKLFKEAKSDNYLAMKSSADAAAVHGFVNCANTRYVDFLKEYNDTPVRAYYEEHYPQCTFLPWKSFRSLLDAMQLWLDLPRHYVGAIPPEQLPWLDMFSMNPEDMVSASEIINIVDVELSHIARLTLQSFDEYAFCKKHGLHEIHHLHDLYRMDDVGSDARRDREIIDTLRDKLKPFIEQFQQSFFVVAPQQAFNVTMDFRKRLEELLIEEHRPTIPPDDPLVVRFVQHGCLVVAAWGDEAATLNQLVNDITKPEAL